jgi:ligand-binding sensor domain-containing protein/serine phosphatase RsbU (regulator of sigma subunit)
MQLAINKSKIINLFLLLLLIISLRVHAQNYNFNHYSLKDGLIQSNVNDILQDKQGYIWFATDGGLSKFNGQTFNNYSTNEGLSESSVSSICEDDDGQLWIGHSYGKLSYKKGNKFVNLPLDVKDKPSKILDLTKDKKGNIWIGTTGSGVIKLNPKTKSYKAYGIKEKLDDQVFCSFVDANSKIWFVTYIGVKYYDALKDSFIFFKPKGFPFFEYTCMTQDKLGDYWFGTANQGIIHYSIKDSISTQYGIDQGLKSNFITNLLPDENNNIWAATWDGGIVKIIGNKTTNNIVKAKANKDYNLTFPGKEIISITTNNGLQSNKIRSIFIDREAMLWAGLQDKGIAQFKGFKFTHFSSKDGLINNIVNSIIKDDNGYYWLGTNEGIDIVNIDKNYTKKSVQHINLTNDLRNNLVTSFCKKDNKIYVSTFKGDIGVFDAKTKKRIQTLSINRSLVNDLAIINNQLWIATSTGLTTYNFGNLEFKDVPEMDKLIIIKIHQTKDGIVWIGTRESGLWFYDGKDFKRYKNKINHNSPTSLCSDKDGNLWIGTEGGGVYKKHENEITNFNVKNGLASDYITLLTCDSLGNIWTGTNMGLVKINVQKNTFTHYGIQEGFTSIETKNNAVFNDNNESLWFGTINGTTVLRLNEEKTNSAVPLVYLINYQVFSTPYPISNNPTFSHNKNDITFNFIGLSFSNASKIKYTYKLEGLDEAWHVDYGISKVAFTHLPPGQYKFILNACSSDGICIDKNINFAFEIIPPIYKRTWFIVLMLLLAVVLVFIYITFKTRYLLAAKLMLEEQVKERTIEIEQKNQSLIDKNLEIITKNKEITDSINYAKKIQEAILPSTQSFRNLFPKAFILYQPKDIVSGDFYWFADIKAKSKNQSDENDIYLAVADCTGHGVPGAFMCMIGSSLLNQIVQENNDFRPSNTLEQLHTGIREALKQQETEARDGMDIALCHINRKKQQIEFAGALRSLLVYRGNTYKEKFAPEHAGIFVQEIQADKHPIGGLQSEAKRQFTNHTIPYYPGDTIYLFTDGFADQFGGPKGKKLMSKNFKEILSSVQDKNMLEQYNHLDNFLKEWKDGYDQVDDILVVGIRF